MYFKKGFKINLTDNIRFILWIAIFMILNIISAILYFKY